MSDSNCFCDCHFHPGIYAHTPCSACGHDDSAGEINGGIVYGHWTKNQPDNFKRPGVDDRILSAIVDLKFILDSSNQAYTPLAEKTPTADQFKLGLQIMHDALVWAAGIEDFDSASNMQTRDLFEENLQKLRAMRHAIEAAKHN